MNMVNEERKVIEKALMFATIAHSGNARKAQPNTPQIMHSISVAEILRQYGADSNVIAASFLHDVPEDTKYTLEDIQKNFGQDIAHLVEIVTEKDKTKSWEERKTNKIKEMQNRNLREKLIEIADKISNIEDMHRLFNQKGFRDFSSFNRGEKQQKWYYETMYKALAQNEDKNNPLLIRLKNDIENVFGRDYGENEQSIEL